jgi:hypothetical protein
MRLPVKAIGALVLLCLLSAGAAPAQPSGEFYPDWRDQHVWPYPIAPFGNANPVLTRYSVTDATAYFVADPFLMRAGDLWYMFFEVAAPTGKIGVATSSDGVGWTYDRLVLRPGTHVSYPYVFRYQDEYFMTLESGATQSVPLYKSASFPYEWTQVATLATGREFADPTIFYWNNTWWMFVSRSSNDQCYLYFSNQLQGGWVEHPQSPIAHGVAVSRPAGRVMVVDGTHIIRLAQDCQIAYGHGVRAFQVDVLTRTSYAEHEIPDSPILTAVPGGWGDLGMHQCDEWWNGSIWLAAVDGRNSAGWSIGVYYRPGTPADAVPLTDFAGPLRVYPNPVRVGESVQILSRGGRTDGRQAIEIFDPVGRLVYRSGTMHDPASPVPLVWNGRDPAGRELSPGVYFVRAGSDGSGGPEQAKIIITR